MLRNSIYRLDVARPIVMSTVSRILVAVKIAPQTAFAFPSAWAEAWKAREAGFSAGLSPRRTNGTEATAVLRTARGWDRLYRGSPCPPARGLSSVSDRKAIIPPYSICWTSHTKTPSVFSRDETKLSQQHVWVCFPPRSSLTTHLTAAQQLENRYSVPTQMFHLEHYLRRVSCSFIFAWTKDEAERTPWP